MSDKDRMSTGASPDRVAGPGDVEDIRVALRTRLEPRPGFTEEILERLRRRRRFEDRALSVAHGAAAGACALLALILVAGPGADLWLSSLLAVLFAGGFGLGWIRTYKRRSAPPG